MQSQQPTKTQSVEMQTYNKTGSKVQIGSQTQIHINGKQLRGQSNISIGQSNINIGQSQANLEYKYDNLVTKQWYLMVRRSKSLLETIQSPQFRLGTKLMLYYTLPMLITFTLFIVIIRNIFIMHESVHKNFDSGYRAKCQSFSYNMAMLFQQKQKILLNRWDRMVKQIGHNFGDIDNINGNRSIHSFDNVIDIDDQQYINLSRYKDRKDMEQYFNRSRNQDPKYYEHEVKRYKQLTDDIWHKKYDKFRNMNNYFFYYNKIKGSNLRETIKSDQLRQKQIFRLIKQPIIENLYSVIENNTEHFMTQCMYFSNKKPVFSSNYPFNKIMKYIQGVDSERTVSQTIDQCQNKTCELDMTISKELYEKRSQLYYVSEIYQIQMSNYNFFRYNISNKVQAYRTYCASFTPPAYKQDMIIICSKLNQEPIIELINQNYQIINEKFKDHFDIYVIANVDKFGSKQVQEPFIINGNYSIDNYMNNMNLKTMNSNNQKVYNDFKKENYHDPNIKSIYSIKGKQHLIYAFNMSLFNDRELRGEGGKNGSIFVFAYDLSKSLTLGRVMEQELSYNQQNITVFGMMIWVIMISFLVVLIVLRLRVIINVLHELTMALNQIINGDDECEINIMDYNDRHLDKIQYNFRCITSLIRCLNKDYFMKFNDNDQIKLINYAHVYRMIKQIDNKHVKGMLLNNVGNIFVQQQNYDKAIDHYDQSVQIVDTLIQKINDNQRMEKMMSEIRNRNVEHDEHDSYDGHNQNYVQQDGHNQNYVQQDGHNQNYGLQEGDDPNQELLIKDQDSQYEQLEFEGQQWTDQEAEQNKRELMDIKYNRQYQLLNAIVHRNQQQKQNSLYVFNQKQVDKLIDDLNSLYQHSSQQQEHQLLHLEKMIFCNLELSNLYQEIDKIEQAYQQLQMAKRNVKQYRQKYTENMDQVVPYQIIETKYYFRLSVFYFGIGHVETSVRYLEHSIREHKIYCLGTRKQQLLLLQKIKIKIEQDNVADDDDQQQIQATDQQQSQVSDQVLVMVDDQVSKRKQIHGFTKKVIEEVRNTGEIGIFRFGQSIDELFKIQSIKSKYSFVQKAIGQLLVRSKKSQKYSKLNESIKKGYTELAKNRSANLRQCLIVITANNSCELESLKLDPKVRLVIIAYKMTQEQKTKISDQICQSKKNVIVELTKKEQLEVVQQVIFQQNNVQTNNVIEESLN